METKKHLPPQVMPSMDSRPLFNVVIVYEDFAAGKHAKETFDYLVQQLSNDYEFTNQMWKFDILENPKMQEMAVKDAVLADLIIVSAHGMGPLPESVKSWIEQWVPQKTNAMAALVALVNPPTGEVAPEAAAIRDYLHDIAERASIGFFAQPLEWPESNDDFSMGESTGHSGRSSDLMANLIQSNAFSAYSGIPVPAGTARWGINE